MKFGSGFRNLFKIKCTKLYSDFTFLLHDIYGISFLPDTVYILKAVLDIKLYNSDKLLPCNLLHYLFVCYVCIVANWYIFLKTEHNGRLQFPYYPKWGLLTALRILALWIVAKLLQLEA